MASGQRFFLSALNGGVSRNEDFDDMPTFEQFPISQSPELSQAMLDKIAEGLLRTKGGHWEAEATPRLFDEYDRDYPEAYSTVHGMTLDEFTAWREQQMKKTP